MAKLPKTDGYVRWQMLGVVIALFGIVTGFILTTVSGVQAEVRETRNSFLSISQDVAEIKADVKIILRELGI